MKFNIFSINFVAFRDAVVNNPECEYITMHEETLRFLQECGYVKPLLINNDLPHFYGVPIFTDSHLLVGQIELVMR